MGWRERLIRRPTRWVSPYAAPARCKDLRGLPPAYILTVEIDPLRDEGIRYALRLIEAGDSHDERFAAAIGVRVPASLIFTGELH